jgi:ankyrin repeat protein
MASSSNSEALFKAARENDCVTIRKLHSQGVDIRQCNEHGFSAMCYVVQRGHHDAIRCLHELDNTLIHRESSSKFSAWGRACLSGRSSVARLLIALGLDINKKNSKGVTPIYQATTYDFAEGIDALMEAGCTSINIPCLGGGSPLDVSIIGGHNKARRALEKHGAEHVQDLSTTMEEAVAIARSRLIIEDFEID